MPERHGRTLPLSIAAEARYAEIKEGILDGVRSVTIVQRRLTSELRSYQRIEESVSNRNTYQFVCECQHVAVDHQRVVVTGEIDIATGPYLSGVLREAQTRARRVVLDLDKTTFIDAGGARILLAADEHARAIAGTFAIANPTAPVERLLRLVGADRTLAGVHPREHGERACA